MGVFKEAKPTLFIWLGFIVFGAFELLYAILNIDLYNNGLCKNSSSKACDFHYLIYVGFFFNGIAKIVGFLPKLNNLKLIAMIVFIVHLVMIFFGVVGMGGVSNETTGFDNFTDTLKAKTLKDGVFLFGSSVSSRWCNCRSDSLSSFSASFAISRSLIDLFLYNNYYI